MSNDCGAIFKIKFAVKSFKLSANEILGSVPVKTFRRPFDEFDDSPMRYRFTVIRNNSAVLVI